MRWIREIAPPPTRPVPPGGWRLLAPALITWGVVAVLLPHPGAAPWFAGGTLIVGTVLLLGTWRWPRLGVMWGLLVLCFAALLLTCVRTAVLQGERAANPLASAATTHRELTLQAELTAFPSVTTGLMGQRGWVAARSTGVLPSVPVLLWLDEPAPLDWVPGLQVTVRGSPLPLAPGDAAAFGIGVSEIIAPSHAQNSSGEGFFGAFVGRVAGELRAGLRAAAEAIPGAELVPGLAVGDTSLVGGTLDRDLRDSSLAHLTAVSGANCALVTGAVAVMAARLGAGRRLRVIVAAVGLAAFVAVVGPDPSVLRATVMAIVVLISRFGGRPEAGLPALGIAILVLLIIDPWQALQAGFALSVVATGGILLLAGPLTLAARALWLPRPLAVAVAVAAAAQFSCGPFLLLLQPGIPAVGVLANVLAAPAAPIGTALGLSAALAAPVFQPLGWAFVWLAAWPARWITMVAEVSAALPLARWVWPDGWPGAILLTVTEGAILLAWFVWSGRLRLPGTPQPFPRLPWQPAQQAPRTTRIAVAVLAASSVGIIVSTSLISPLAERVGVPRDWAIIICDVAQGDAILLRDPASPRRVTLVDTGAEPELLGACFQRFGITQIELLVLTHDDQDHVGALDQVVDLVDHALISPTTREDAATLDDAVTEGSGRAADLAEPREVVRVLESAGVPYSVGSAGDVSAPGSSIDWRVLSPVRGTVPDRANAASLVMVAKVGGLSVLLLGDTGQAEQAALLRAHPSLHADVLKVSHHGSRDREPGLPERVGAELALVSVGAKNRYGHPNPQVITELTLAGIPLLRTDEHGSLAITLGPNGGPSVWVERAEPRVGAPQ